MRAIRIERFGGPEVLELHDDLPQPAGRDGTELLQVTAAGVNYADTHQADNSYLDPAELPLIPGGEAVGRTPDGRRVVALLAGGGYAEYAVAARALTWELPEAVEDAHALALVLQGTTAWHLLRTSAHLRSGETVVVHAAGGGVGTLAVQLARRMGAGRIIAVAGASKHDLMLSLGADICIDADHPDLTLALQEANDGRGVDVVLEMVGGATFQSSLEALAPLGRLVHFGQAARQGAPEVDPGILLRRSWTVSGFWLVHLLSQPGRLTEALDDMFAAVLDGSLRPVVGGTYPLADDRQAHEDLRARTTTGKLVLQVA